MKAIKNITQTKTQKEINILILNKSHKFNIIPFKLDEHRNYFEVYGTRIIRENKLSVVCDLKSLRGNINNIKFNFESLDKELLLRYYLRKQNHIEFINKLSLNYNNKNWFNINKNSLGRILPREFSSNENSSNDKKEFDIGYLEETCILSNKISENFTEIPVYWYDKNVNQKYRTTIVTLEIITDILSKVFPLFKTQIHNLLVTELNISEIKEETLEERTKLSYDELLELYNKQQKELESYKIKNKSISYEDLSKKYDNYMETSNSFREETKRYVIDTQEEFISNYKEGDKISYNKTLQTKLRSTSSINLGNKGEQIIKELLENLGYKPIDKSKVAHSEDLWIIDEINKIIYLFEVKNKKSINKDDLVKFNKDMTDITNLYQDYSIIGIFINLLDVNISSDIKKFKVESNKIYLTLNYISEELLQTYIETMKENIIKLRNIPSAEDNTKYRETTENTYNSIQTEMDNIVTSVNKVKSKISSTNVNNSITSIENSIINYIKNNKKWTKKYILEHLDSKHIIVKTSWNKSDIIKWYNNKIST